MDSVSGNVEARARKNYTTMLKALADCTQTFVAAQLGCNESTVSRWKDGEFEKTAKALAVMGLKIVPEDVQCFAPEYIQSLRTLAKIGVATEPAHHQLNWNES